jgi:hypothetical protein
MFAVYSVYSDRNKSMVPRGLGLGYKKTLCALERSFTSIGEFSILVGGSGGGLSPSGGGLQQIRGFFTIIFVRKLGCSIPGEDNSWQLRQETSIVKDRMQLHPTAEPLWMQRRQAVGRPVQSRWLGCGAAANPSPLAAFSAVSGVGPIPSRDLAHCFVA